MANMKPENLILRCYGHKTENENWYGLCIDLNIAVEADSPQELRNKMADAISSYIDTVIDTDDKESIPDLLSRRAPILDRLKYYLICIVLFSFKTLQNTFTFKEVIPFHLAHNF